MCVVFNKFLYGYLELRTEKIGKGYAKGTYSGVVWYCIGRIVGKNCVPSTTHRTQS